MLFVAIEGTHEDGSVYLADAAARGCPAALVARRDTAAAPLLPCFQVDNPRRALALIAHRLAGDPSQKMTVVGVTGTNGKTTVAYMMEAIINAAGMEPGVLTTVNMRWTDTIEVASRRRPRRRSSRTAWRAWSATAVRAVAMEVSSHASTSIAATESGLRPGR